MDFYSSCFHCGAGSKDKQPIKGYPLSGVTNVFDDESLTISRILALIHEVEATHDIVFAPDTLKLYGLDPKYCFLCHEYLREAISLCRAKRIVDRTSFWKRTGVDSYMAIKQQGKKRLEAEEDDQSEVDSVGGSRSPERNGSNMKGAKKKSSVLEIVCENICHGRIKHGLLMLVKNFPAGRQAFQDVVRIMAKKEMMGFEKTGVYSKQRLTLQTLCDFSWERYLEDTKIGLPILHSLLDGVVTRKKEKTNPNEVPQLGLIVSCILHLRNELKFQLIQNMITVQLIRHQCSPKLLKWFSKIGIGCLCTYMISCLKEPPDTTDGSESSDNEPDLNEDSEDDSSLDKEGESSETAVRKLGKHKPNTNSSAGPKAKKAKFDLGAEYRKKFTKPWPWPRKEFDVLSDGSRFECDFCKSSHFENDPDFCERDFVAPRPAPGKKLNLCNQCNLLMDSLFSFHERKGVPVPQGVPAPQKEKKSLSAAAQEFTCKLVDKMNDPSAKVLFCPGNEDERCSCIQRYIGTQDLRRATELLNLYHQARHYSHPNLKKGKLSRAEKNKCAKETPDSFKAFVYVKRQKLLRGKLCEAAIQKILNYPPDFFSETTKKHVNEKDEPVEEETNPEEGRRKKMKTFLEPLENLKDKECCVEKCGNIGCLNRDKGTMTSIEVPHKHLIPKHISLVRGWRDRAKTGSSQVRPVIEEMLLKRVNKQINCYNFISMVTGRSLNTILTISYQISLGQPQKEKPKKTRGPTKPLKTSGKSKKSMTPKSQKSQPKSTKSIHSRACTNITSKQASTSCSANPIKDIADVKMEVGNLESVASCSVSSNEAPVYPVMLVKSSSFTHCTSRSSPPSMINKKPRAVTIIPGKVNKQNLMSSLSLKQQVGEKNQKLRSMLFEKSQLTGNESSLVPIRKEPITVVPMNYRTIGSKQGSSVTLVPVDNPHSGIKQGSSVTLVPVDNPQSGIKQGSSVTLVPVDNPQSGIKQGSSVTLVPVDNSQSGIKQGSSVTLVPMDNSQSGIKQGSSVTLVPVNNPQSGIKQGSSVTLAPVDNPQSGIKQGSSVTLFPVDNPQSGIKQGSSVTLFPVDNPQSGIKQGSSVTLAQLDNAQSGIKQGSSVTLVPVNNPQSGIKQGSSVTLVPVNNPQSGIKQGSSVTLFPVDNPQSGIKQGSCVTLVPVDNAQSGIKQGSSVTLFPVDNPQSGIKQGSCVTLAQVDNAQSGLKLGSSVTLIPVDNPQSGVSQDVETLVPGNNQQHGSGRIK